MPNIKSVKTHALKNARRYGFGCVIVGVIVTVGPFAFDFIAGVCGNLVASVVGPVFGIH